jgi:hypothetical protein
MPPGYVLISAKSTRTLWSVRWEGLDEFVAYKVDAYVVDRVCLALIIFVDEKFDVK